MDEATVATAIVTLQTQGKEPSIGNLRKALGGGSNRDITRHRKKLLPHVGRAQPMRDVTRTVDAPPVAVLEPARGPDAPAVVEPPPAPLPLLAQAEAALRQAQAEERRIRRGLAEPGSPITWEDLGCCAQATRQAQGQVDTLERSTASLRAAIPGMRIDARRAAGELAVLEEQIRRSLIKARREAQQAQAALEQMEADLLAIAGVTVPVEMGNPN